MFSFCVLRRLACPPVIGLVVEVGALSRAGGPEHWPQGDSCSDHGRMRHKVAATESSTGLGCGSITRIHNFHSSEMPPTSFAGSTDVIA